MATTSRSRTRASSAAGEAQKKAPRTARGASARSSASAGSRRKTSRAKAPQRGRATRLADSAREGATRLADSARGAVAWGRQHRVAVGSILVAAVGIGVAAYALFTMRSAKSCEEEGADTGAKADEPHWDVDSLTTSHSPSPLPVPEVHPATNVEQAIKPRRARAL